ncbi:MAG: penicillin acylase family protein [Methylococcales bacterium]|nr:penicillin acylase family protein [Methylococcales bacterium]
MFPKGLRAAFLVVVVAVAVVSALVSYQVVSSLPQRSGRVSVSGLGSAVAIRFDAYGIPDIRAATREDAAFSLGYVTAGDRLFQMDLVRRKATGRLAEIFGAAALASDIEQLHLDFGRVAERLVDDLPAEHRAVLVAYARGVNSYIRNAETLAPEFTLLQYEPSPWTPRDSMLAVLGMFQLLSWTEPEERMLSVMQECLPEQVASFLTPDTDLYPSVLIGGSGSSRPIGPVPAADLAAVLMENRDLQAVVNIDTANEARGSNNWVVNRHKTADGRAILSNDMHLPLSVPNTWYRATQRYGGRVVSGLSLPGLPAIVAGSNGRVAWGFTNFMADVLDLVKLELDPENPQRYRTRTGWRKLQFVEHQILVKEHKPQTLVVRVSEWGPVWMHPLLGHPVAVHWTALDPQAVGMGLIDLDRVGSVEEAAAILRGTGGPPQNVLLADQEGNIAWTLMGYFPRRRPGFDGTVSTDWRDGTAGWNGFLRPDELPQVVNPEAGFLATANNRTIGRGYPHILGHNFAYGYRAYRISERLRAMQAITEKELFQLQLDSRTAFYDFYRDLVVSLVSDEYMSANPLLAEVRAEVDQWDGFARAESRGLPLLAAFRNRLVKRVFAPFLKSCATRDKEFAYGWYQKETPLRQLLTEKIPETLPSTDFESWDDFLRAVLEESAVGMKKRLASATLENVTWTQFREVRIRHPLSHALPWLSGLLDMPQQALGGCVFCVRVISQGLSASERLVISPGQFGRGILHLPGGQSGHFLSDNYSDQYPYWANGRPMPFVSDRVSQVLHLEP